MRTRWAAISASAATRNSPAGASRPWAARTPIPRSRAAAVRAKAPRHAAALERNLVELQRAIINRRAMVVMESIGISNDCLKVIYYALFNDYVAHCIKVFERNSGMARLTRKLKQSRDKTHFDIDRDGVLDAGSVWQEAGLDDNELVGAVDATWARLNAAREKMGLPPMEVPPYDDETMRIMTVAAQEGRLP